MISFIVNTIVLVTIMLVNIISRIMSTAHSHNATAARTIATMYSCYVTWSGHCLPSAVQKLRKHDGILLTIKRNQPWNSFGLPENVIGHKWTHMHTHIHTWLTHSQKPSSSNRPTMSQVRRPLLYSSLVRTSRLQLGHLICVGMSLKLVAVTITCWRERGRAGGRGERDYA